MAFTVLICNWRSSLGLRTPSSNADAVVFTVATLAIPFGLWRAARSLQPIVRAVLQICAVILIVVAALVVFWNGLTLGFMFRRGVELTPVIATAERDSVRIAAYQVEVFLEGAFVRIRQEQRLFPGVLLVRDIAYVDDPYIDGLEIRSPTSVCVTFSAAEARLADVHRQADALLHFGSWTEWIAPVQLSPRSPTQKCPEDRG